LRLKNLGDAFAASRLNDRIAVEKFLIQFCGELFAHNALADAGRTIKKKFHVEKEMRETLSAISFSFFVS
jgi:hypothetical protein